jgi:uncharacterized protein
MDEWLLGAAIAFVVSLITTPAGVSGAVLLLPVQVGLLGVPSAVATPTNLVYNVVALPGAVTRRRGGRAFSETLTRLVVLGATPGVVGGALLRATVLDDPDAFLAVIALVLVPLGGWLLLGPSPKDSVGSGPAPVVIVLAALAAGVVGGVYGIGGGSIVAPALVTLGLAARTVAPAALVATFVTSVVGLATFELLALGGGADGADWGLGIALGLGGLAGGVVGAGVQHRVPEAALRRLLGLLILATGLRYAWLFAAAVAG